MHHIIIMLYSDGHSRKIQLTSLRDTMRATLCRRRRCYNTIYIITITTLEVRIIYYGHTEMTGEF